MKKKILLSLMLVVLIIVACIALVACGESNCKCSPTNGNGTTETRTAYIIYHFTITAQFTDAYNFTLGSLLNKPEIPTYINKVFNAGYGITQDGYVAEFDLPIKNPRMEPGYKADSDYRFIAWYTEPEFLYQWNFAEDRVYRDITLYAKWVEI